MKPQRRLFNFALLLMTAVCGIASAAERPNVVVIMADGETRNVIDQHPELAEQLKSQLAELIAAGRSRPR